MKKIKLGELFCGPGGLAIGAHDAAKKIGVIDLSHAWAVDSDQDTCKTYLKNVKGATSRTVFCEDIREKTIFKKLKDAEESIDGLAFGFPCNDFSLVGRQLGLDGEFGPLFSYGIKALKQFSPDFFIAENVGGLISANKGLALELILEKMRSVGYEITPHLYKFEEYGVPQARHRLIIVGFKKELNIKFIPPKPTHVNRFITSREALEAHPISSTALNHEFTKQSNQVEERLRYIKPGENAWNAKIPKDLQLNVNGAKLSQIYKRLDPNRPAYTITGSGGGGTHVYHWRENRALTNRERARLQTFEDAFQFMGNRGSVRKQIGMAVPPKGSAVIFEAVFKTLLGIKYSGVEINTTRKFKE
jgi:DNA (cytosine-5)-methyltransferase 1